MFVAGNAQRPRGKDQGERILSQSVRADARARALHVLWAVQPLA